MNTKRGIIIFNAAASIILALFSVSAFAQTFTVRGTVTDEKNEAVIGASVYEKGSRTGVSTDIDGKYSIEVRENAILEFNYLGYVRQTVKVSGRSDIDIQLVPDNELLESVIVVGYGTKKKGSVTGAVSGIGSEDIIKTKTENPQNMLTGRIPGLRVWQKSSEPGVYNSVIDIRGMGAPMVIIDGVPRSVEDFNRINAADIDNVSVLKDASAAIYGVRGGNGVILVTTKKGKAEETKVNYEASFTFQVPASMPALTDVAGTIQLYNERNLNRVDGAGTSIYSKELISDYANGIRTAGDWNNDVMSKISPQTVHNMSISGGSEKVQYFLSMGYIYQEGFFRSRDLNYDKFNIRSNINVKITEGLFLDANLSCVSDNRNNPYYSAVDIIRNYWSRGVLYPAYADPERTMLSYNGLDLDENAVAMMTADVSGYRRYKKKQIYSSVSLKYDFAAISEKLKGLSVNLLASYDFRYDNNEAYKKEYYLYAPDSGGGYTQKLFANSSPSELSKSAFDTEQKLGQATINFQRDFGKHHFSALAGWEVQRRTAENFRAEGELLYATPYFTALTKENQQAGIDLGADVFHDLAYMAAIGRLNYDFDNRFLIEAQFREDASSKFAENHRWGFFPSVSAAWRISEEPWFKKSKAGFINQLKIRTSYGILGDDSAVNYEWETGYTYLGGSTSSDGWYNGYSPGYVFNDMFVYGIAPQPIANLNVTWLKSKTFNVGIDIEAWRGLFGISADYFHRYRTGIFAQNSDGLPTVVGSEPPVENLESDHNYGFEIQLSHRYKIWNLEYSILGMASITRRLYGHSVSTGTYGNSYERWRNSIVNRYTGIAFGYASAGRFEDWEDIWSYEVNHGNSTLPGDYKYLDWNEDGEINGLDEHPYAYASTPWLNYSLACNVKWKKFDFSLLLQGSGMGSMSYKEPLYAIWGHNGGGALEQYMDRWHPSGEWTDPYDQALEWNKGYYALTGHSPYENSSFNRVSTAYLRLKQIEVGYTLPRFAKDKIEARIYINAYNSLTLTKVKFVDPEHPDDNLGRLYPLNKTFTLGLNLIF